jgi:hypothetical protein
MERGELVSDESRASAVATLSAWLADRGDGARRVDPGDWVTTELESGWLFTAPGRTNSAYVVRSTDVVNFAPSTTTVEEALLMLDEPARRLHDGIDPSYPSRTATYTWAALGPVMAAAITREDRLGAFVFVGVDDESASAGVLRRQMPDAVDVGRHVHAQLEGRFQAGVAAEDAVRACLGSRDPNGDVAAELRRYEGGKRELWALLNPERAARDRLLAERAERR